MFEINFSGRNEIFGPQKNWVEPPPSNPTWLRACAAVLFFWGELVEVTSRTKIPNTELVGTTNLGLKTTLRC